MAGRNPKIVIIGPTYADLAVKCEDFPMPGVQVRGSALSTVITGHGPNSAIQTAMCGCDSHLITKIGQDTFGKMALDRLTSHNVNTDHIFSAPAISTGAIMTMVNNTGENISCISPGANKSLCVDEIENPLTEQIISEADVVLVFADLPAEATSTAIRLANLHRKRIVLQVDMDFEEGCDLSLPCWPKEFFLVDLLVPNFMNYSPSADTAAGCVHKFKMFGSELVANGFPCTAFHIHSRGSIVVNRHDGPIHVPPFNTTDRVWANDVFVAALAACFATGDQAQQAVRFATAAGTLASQRYGTSEPFASREEIIELLQQHAD